MSLPNPTTPSECTSTQKLKSSVRPTRAIHRDRQKRPSVEVCPEEINTLIEEIVHPATLSHGAEYRRLGLRERTVTLPVMVSFFLGLIWRQRGTVAEAVRVLNPKGLFWTGPITVSSQAMINRMKKVPADLFQAIFEEILPQMHERWKVRSRPLPAAVVGAKSQYTDLLAIDGSTLDSLNRKVNLTSDRTSLAGRMAALLDVASHLPRKIWYEEESEAHDQTFWERMFEALPSGCLVLFDLGFVNYALFDRLSRKGVKFITRLKQNAAYKEVEVLREGPKIRDVRIRLGQGATACETAMRSLSVLYQGIGYRYLTNEVAPEILSSEQVVALYWQRWRIEDAF